MATITEINGDANFVRRLFTMGLFVGEKVTVLCSVHFSRGVVVGVNGVTVAMGKEAAALIETDGGAE